MLRVRLKISDLLTDSTTLVITISRLSQGIDLRDYLILKLKTLSSTCFLFYFMSLDHNTDILFPLSLIFRLLSVNNIMQLILICLSPLDVGRKSTDEILNNEVENEHYHRNVDLGGHVNILFSYDEDLSPGMRVQYGQEIGGHGSGFGLLQDVTDVLCIAPSNILVTDLVNNRLQVCVLFLFSITPISNACVGILGNCERRDFMVTRDPTPSCHAFCRRDGCPRRYALTINTYS